MGCAVFTALGIYLTLAQKSNHWIVAANALLAVLFLVLATFLAWRDQHIQLQSERKKTQRPLFKIEAERAVLLLNDPFSPSLLLNVTMMNLSGAASSIRVFSISAKASATEENLSFFATEFQPRRLLKQHEKIVTIDGFTEPVLETLRTSEPLSDLSQRLKQQTLVMGKHEDGWLLFEHVPRRLVSPESIHLKLSVIDAFGVQHDTQPFDLKLERAKW